MPGSDTQVQRVDTVLIKVDGSTISAETMAALLQLEIEDTLDLPSMAAVTFHEQDAEISSGTQFAVGQEMEILFPGANSTSTTPSESVFKGEVVSIEPHFEEDYTATVTIRAFDKRHRLNRATQITTYTQIKASDVVSRLCSDVGVPCSATDTAVVHDSLVVRGQTALEFILMLAERYNYEVAWENNQLQFRPMALGSEVAAFSWGVNLLSFHPRISAAAQPNEVLVRGWDQKQGQAIVGQASTATAHVATGFSSIGGTLANSNFGAAKFYTLNDPVANASDATKLAQGMLDTMNAAGFEADGTLLGNPLVRAGKTIKIEKVGAKFSGKYRITTAVHEFTAEDGYRTRFRCEGARRKTLSSLVGGDGGGEMASSAANQNALAHVMMGVVTDNNDPENLGRVKVKYPLLGDNIEGYWAPVVVPGGGNQAGLYWLPTVNDQVLVVFMQGDVNRPFVIGGVYSSARQPPLTSSNAVANGAVKQYTFKTVAGHEISISDDQSAKWIQLKTTDGSFIKIDETNKSVNVDSQGKFGGKAVQDMSMETNAKFSAKSTGPMELKGTASITIETTGNLTIKGSMVSVEASGPLTLKGATVMIN